MSRVVLGAFAALGSVAYALKKEYDFRKEKKRADNAEELYKKQKTQRENNSKQNCSKESQKDQPAWVVELNENLGPFFEGFILIDSNVWMREPGQLFNSLKIVLREHKGVIQLPSAQYEELERIKDKRHQGRHRRARYALKRIEEFQKNKLLKIGALGFDKQEKPYADPIFLEALSKAANEYSHLLFITDDRSLRVRSRVLHEQLDTKKAQLAVEVSENFVKEVEKYRKYLELNKLNSSSKCNTKV